MIKASSKEKNEELKKFIEDEEKKPEDRFKEILRGCVFHFDESESTSLMKDGKVFFEFEKHILWCSYVNVWSIFEKEYSMSYNEIEKLVKIQMEKRFNCKGVTPFFNFSFPGFKMEKRLNK